MARNNTRRPNTRTKNNTRSPARRSNKKKSAARPNGDRRRTAPGCLWFICGICLATAGAATLYILDQPDGTRTQQISIDTPNGRPRQDARDSNKQGKTRENHQPAGKEQPEQEPRFSFYKMLPNYKVDVPDAGDEKNPQEGHRPKSTSHNAPEKRQQHDTGRSNQPPSASGHQQKHTRAENSAGHIIQAGAFSTHADAERRKAKLALLGIPARIVDIDLESGKTVYRVQSKAISSSAKLQRLVNRLHQNNVDTMVRSVGH